MIRPMCWRCGRALVGDWCQPCDDEFTRLRTLNERLAANQRVSGVQNCARCQEQPRMSNSDHCRACAAVLEREAHRTYSRIWMQQRRKPLTEKRTA